MVKHETKFNSGQKVSYAVILIFSFVASAILFSYGGIQDSVLLLLLATFVYFMRKYETRHSSLRGLITSITAFLIASTVFGTYLDFFDKYTHYDKLVHFVSGFLLGSVSYYFIVRLHENRANYFSEGFTYVLTILFGIAVGTVWELIEFGFDSIPTLNTTYQASLNDTMWDLLLDTLGVCIFVGIIYSYKLRKLKRRQESRV